jgi:hypothetical protein
MTPLAVLALVMCAILFAVLVYAGVRIEKQDAKIDLLQSARLASRAVSHAQCVVNIEDYVSAVFAAEVLRAAAGDWDSTKEQANLHRLAREKYQPGGPSMPVIWLNDRANRIDPRPEPTAEYNFAGERVL